MNLKALRLTPGQDLRQAIEEWAKKENITAAGLITGMGSLTVASIRLAEDKNPRLLTGPFEICHMAGTASQAGSHMHMVIADREGKTLGGHLSKGSIVYTTAELVFAVSSELEFLREWDSSTQSLELVFKKHSAD